MGPGSAGDGPNGARAPDPPSMSAHEQHRVLTVRGKGYCNSDCIFCIEKHGVIHPDSPVVDQIRTLIVEGGGRYNMLFFANGEPSLNPKLLEYVALGRTHGYRYFGMSSHFRAFADPAVALRMLQAGFEHFDISLHAASFEAQLAVNPIDDGGRSLKEALLGLRNLQHLARQLGKRVVVSHKIVITRQNYRDLVPIFALTHALGVRHFVLQPVKAGDLSPGLQEMLAIGEAEFMPALNDFLRRTEDTGARIKLYGMSQLDAYPSRAVEQETNLVKNLYGRQRKAQPPVPAPAVGLERSAAPPVAPSAERVHLVTLRPPRHPTITFECHEDEFILNAALAHGAVVSYGCRMGSCSSCCSKIVEGRVELTEQLVLSDAQILAGYTLLCRSKPRSRLVIDSDKEHDLGR